MGNQRLIGLKLSDLFHNRVVWVIVAATLCGQAGIWIRFYAVMMFIMAKTHNDPVAISMLTVAEFAPVVLFSFIGGTFADRLPPKRKMILCDLLNAVFVFTVLILVIFFSWKAVYLLPLAYAALMQFSQPAGLKLFKKNLRENQMQAGISIYQTVFSVFILVGPILGTFVFQNYGVNIAIALMGTMYIISALIQILLPADQETEKKIEKPSILLEMKHGLHYMLSKKMLKKLSGCFVVTYLAFGLVQPLNVFLVSERLKLGTEYLQWLLTANGAGTILSGLLIMILAKKVTPQQFIFVGIIVNAIGWSTAVLSTQLWLTLLAQFVCGLMMPTIQIGLNTLILQKTQTNYFGRVNGILVPLYTASLVIASFIAGWLKEQLSLFGIYGITIFLFVFALFFVVPLLRSLVENRQLH
jgi:MFS family permease